MGQSVPLEVIITVGIVLFRYLGRNLELIILMIEENLGKTFIKIADNVFHRREYHDNNNRDVKQQDTITVPPKKRKKTVLKCTILTY
jgi:hypothetical protein